MSKYPQSFDSALITFEKGLKNDSDNPLKARTIRYYVEQARCGFNLIHLVAPSRLPHELTRDDLKAFLDFMASEEYAVSTRKDYVAGVKKICGFYDNHSIVEFRPRWPQDTRPNTDWLKHDEAQQLLDCSKTANQELIVHCELCLGFRRCEVSRMRPGHIHDGYVDVIGKGSMDGKLRVVPFHPRSVATFTMYNKYRNDLKDMAQRRRRIPVEFPASYLIYERTGHLRAYSDVRMTGIDNQLVELRKDLGIHFSNHTLRRTFGRILYFSGVPLATISKLLGHDSVDTTILYLGINLDDMVTAMSMFSLR